MRNRHHPITPFVLLEAAVVASGAGNGIASVAIPWLILERTGDPAAAGLVGAATALPLLLSSLFSGAVVDTLGQRRTSMLSDMLSAISVAAIPVVDFILGLDLGLIMVLAVVGALFDPAGATAREAMLPSVAARGRDYRSSAATASTKRPGAWPTWWGRAWADFSSRSWVRWEPSGPPPSPSCFPSPPSRW